MRLRSRSSSCRWKHGNSTMSSGRTRLASTWLPTSQQDRKSTRLNSSHLVISYAVFCLKKNTYNLAVLSMPASALVRRVFIGLLVANLAVVGVKLAVGITSGSLAVLGGALDSCVDPLTNVLALIIVPGAAKEPDEDHPHGHGKFETLGALAIL